MIKTSKDEVIRAIARGVIVEGDIYHTTCGAFVITELTTNPYGRSAIIGMSAEIDEETGIVGEPTNITAIDLIGAEF